MTTKPKYVTAQMDVSRFGSVAAIKGRVVMGTWSMYRERCLELYRKLGNEARYQDTGDKVHDDK